MSILMPEMRPRHMRVRMVTDAELDDPAFLADVKTFAAQLRVPRRRFLDWLSDGLRDAGTELLDASGAHAEVDFDALERDHIDLWFRDWCKRPLAHVMPRVRAESRERVRVMATLLRMIFPKESTVWGVPLLSLPGGHA